MYDDNQQNITPSPNYYTPYSRPVKQNSFLTASLIFSALAILSFWTIVFPIMFGSLSIVFAILSHRKGEKWALPGKISIIVSSIGIFFSIIFTIVIFAITIIAMTTDGPIHDELDNAFEEVYGMDLEEYMQQINGDESDSLQYDFQ